MEEVGHMGGQVIREITAFASVNIPLAALLSFPSPCILYITLLLYCHYNTWVSITLSAGLLNCNDVDKPVLKMEDCKNRKKIPAGIGSLTTEHFMSAGGEHKTFSWLQLWKHNPIHSYRDQVTLNPWNSTSELSKPLKKYTITISIY